MPILKNDNDIFISYSRKDFSRIKPAIGLLKASGADVFVDVEDIPFGVEWEKNLEDNIKEAERIFVFWSKDAAQSKYVKREYKKAIELTTVLIIPVPLDDTPMPSDLAKYQGLTELGPMLQEATKVNNKGFYYYGLPALFLALILFGVMYMLYQSPRAEIASNTRTSNSSTEPAITPGSGNINANHTANFPPPNNNFANSSNVEFPRATPEIRNTNATASTPHPTSTIKARGGQESPADESFFVKYPLLVLPFIILLIALPTAFIWFRKRKRLIKALRAELFPQAD